MIEEVVSVGLPIRESVVIKKNRLEPERPSTCRRKRFCIVSGIHGDELEGQYVCYELARRIEKKKEHLKGIIDIYPAVNPLGMESVTRRVPTFDLDMNRNFPGNLEGDMSEFIASVLMEDLCGADLCLDIHSSNIFIREVPQVRMQKEQASLLLPFAELLNVEFIWLHDSPTVRESTLVYSLNLLGVPSLAVEMGVGMRITKEYGDRLVDGIFCVMQKLDIWDGPVILPQQPIVSNEGKVAYIHAETSGVFLPMVEHWKETKKGELLGKIVDPLKGETKEEILSPCNGIIFTLREYPVVYNGSLIARLLER